MSFTRTSVQFGIESSWDRSSWPRPNPGLQADMADAEAAQLMPALESVRKALLTAKVPRPLEPVGAYPGAMAARRGDGMEWVDPGIRMGLAAGELEAYLGDIKPSVATAGETVVTVFDRAGSTIWSAPNPLRDPAIVKRDLDTLEDQRKDRDERADEILAQRGYHWAFWGRLMPLSPARTPYTMELMAVLVAFASTVVQRCKVLYNQPRPQEYSQRVQPMIPVPGHASFPGGHAAENRLLALALVALLPVGTPGSKREPWVQELGLMLQTLAARIAENREIAGLHFRSDTQAGVSLADALYGTIVLPLMRKATVAPVPGGANPFCWLCNRAYAEWQ